MEQFTLRIEMGNAAMQQPSDVCGALNEVVERIEHGAELEGSIRDANGNTVGGYAFGNSNEPGADDSQFND